MEKQTIEEAAEKYNDDFQVKGGSKAPHIKNVHIMNHFIAGAKWQQERMYSEEDVFNLCRVFATFVMRTSPSYKKQQEWFEQFKKK